LLLILRLFRIQPHFFPSQVPFCSNSCGRVEIS
jgi:hypothetical protein